MISRFNLSLILIVCCSFVSTSNLEKLLKRRQTDVQYCQSIEGFDCKCSYYRVSCTIDRELPSPINIIESEKEKYQSVELVLMSVENLQINDRTFEPIEQLFKLQADNLEFRVKFEKFTGLHLSSSSIFNRVFPDRIPSTVRKHIALEIYNPEVPPQNDKNLFENLYVDSLELYAFYPFHGTFQDLFNGANIKYLRLSGGDIRTDLSQSFSGNIARLEFAKQANSLSVENFPVYPAHEMIINAFYINDFQNENPPSYNNLVELRVHAVERIPRNAFQQFPNIQTLSISTEKDIDPQALNGLYKLEKLIIKDTIPSIELIQSVPQIKEFEGNIEKFDESTQCQLLEKLVRGDLAVQALPSVRTCNCLSALLEHATGRTPCEVKDCDQSSCSAIRNNYNIEKQQFNNLPSIYRSDGTDAFRSRDIQIYPGPYQVTYEDKLKFERAFPSQRISENEQNRPATDDQTNWNENKNDDDHPQKDEHENNNRLTTKPVDRQDQNDNDQDDIDWSKESDKDKEQTKVDDNDKDIWSDDEKQSEYQKTTTETISIDDESEKDEINQDKSNTENTNPDSTNNQTSDEQQDQQQTEDKNNEQNESSQVKPEDENKQNQSVEPKSEENPPAKRGFSWLPIIIIIASIVGLVLLGFIFFIIHKKSEKSPYAQAPNQEPQTN